MNIVVNITGWRRPDYFAQVIDGIISNPGYTDYKYCVSIDSGGKTQEHLDVVRDRNFKCEFTAHRQRMGCAGNVGHSFLNAFDKHAADAVIMLEDDTVPSPDMLSYTTSMLEEYEDDMSIWNISTYRRRGPVLKNRGAAHECAEGRGDMTKVFRRDHFTSWGWATWRRSRLEIGDNWFGIHWNHKNGLTGSRCPRGEEFLEYVRICNTGSWAWPMNMYWRKDRVEIAPDVSRCQNVGAIEGMFCPGSQWHRENHHVEYWAGDGKYTLTDSMNFYEHNNV